jgi:O-antigen/teichoic acid export membrane protein
MLKKLKAIDGFGKNIIVVFLGTSLVNFFNLIYQLLIAHKLSASDFAAFNSLLSILLLVSSPLATLQTAVAKYSSEFNARGEVVMARSLLAGMFRKAAGIGFVTFFVFLLASSFIMQKLGIGSRPCVYILAGLVALSWLVPVFMGGLQGLELFSWLSVASVAGGVLKLAAAFIFILLGYNIAGALGALLLATLTGIIFASFALKGSIFYFGALEKIDYKEIIVFLLPVALSLFCFMGLVSFDMIMVRYYFSSQDSGLYSIAQMVGKILLFLPGAISIVMFPKASGLNAKNMDSIHILRRSLSYAAGLCVLAALAYNLFPYFALKVLTGKAYPESIILGRLFSVSMSFFTLLFILINYFLSVKDLRFIKYLALFTIFEFLGIVFFHGSLIQVQLVLCAIGAPLFLIHLLLAFKPGNQRQVCREPS